MSAGRMPGTMTLMNFCHAVRAVELRRLELLGRHALDRRREDDHRETGLDPDRAR